MDFVNKIKSADAISLKLQYVRSQSNTNKRGNFQTNRLINVVIMTICSFRVRATWSTPIHKRHLTMGFLYMLGKSKIPIKHYFLFDFEQTFI